jgi:C_GCAxxG_C_C family probable redox protein
MEGAKMGEKAKEGLDLFKKGYFCSQAVLVAFCEDLGMDRQTALRVASGFGGGMGRMGEVCGAVTGAFMVLGLEAWSAGLPSVEEKNKVVARIREFSETFKQRHGSILCKDLLGGCAIGTPEGYKEATDRGLFLSVCRPVVEEVGEILEEMVQANE